MRPFSCHPALPATDRASADFAVRIGNRRKNLSTVISPQERFYPESRYGGFTDIDGTVAFFARVNALLRPSFTVLDFGCGRGSHIDDPAPGVIYSLIERGCQTITEWHVKRETGNLARAEEVTLLDPVPERARRAPS